MTGHLPRPLTDDDSGLRTALHAHLSSSHRAGGGNPVADAIVTIPSPGGLVGRDREVNGLLRRLGQTNLLTLTGPPGVGKSRVASEVAANLGSGGVPGVVVVSVDRISHPGQVAPTVAHALGSAGRGRAGRPVVVLDDCDRLLDACAKAAQALLAQDVTVLATAREPLKVPSESVWRLGPLAVPERGRDELPGLFMQSDAFQLFCERAASAKRGFIPTPDTASSIAQICRQVDGVPLAIELAARAITTYGPAGIAARLDAPFSLLTSGLRTAHPRHRSLWACLAWSFDLLSVAQQTVLEGLAVFPGSFGDQAASEVAAPEGMDDIEVSELLRSLVEKSLIEVEDHGADNPYSLLQMVRWFGLERLAANGEEGAQREAHARWCRRTIQAAGDFRRGRTWLEQLTAHHDDLHAALDWAIEMGEGEMVVLLAQADARLCRAEGRYDDARRRLQQVRAAVTGPPKARSRALAMAGMAELAAGHPAAAIPTLEDSLSDAQVSTGPTDTARARLGLAFAHVLSSGRAALPALENAAPQAASEDRHLAIDGLIGLGQAHMVLGALDRAHDYFDESLALAQTNDDEVGQALALIGLGRTRVALGHYGDAEAAFLEGLELATALGEPEVAGAALAGRGQADWLQGRVESADRWFSEAADLAAAANDRSTRVEALIGLGRNAAGRGDVPGAREMFEAALATARSASLGHLVARVLCRLAEATDDPGEAQALVAEALATAQRWGDKAGEALALAGLAELNQGHGDIRGASNRHRQALLLRGQVGDPAAIADTLEALAHLAAEQGDFLVAARLLGAAHRLRDHHGCIGPQWQVEQRTSLVELARDGLNDETFSAEYSHGASLSTKAALAYAARHSGNRAPRPSTGFEALTEAERRVAELVSFGRTNNQIASDLGIAPPTVKAHLRRVFAKMGVQNRTTLAAAMHDIPQSDR